MFKGNRRIAALTGLGAVALPVAARVAVPAFAQTPTATPPPPPGTVTDSYLNHLASALGIDRARLDTALAQARDQTLAELVTAGRLTQEQADQVRDQAGVRFFLGRRRPKGPGRGLRQVIGPVRQAMRQATLDTLGLTAEQLREALRGGKTLRQLAEERHVTIEQLRAAGLAAARTTLDRLVEAGTVTRAQADRLLAQLARRGGGPGRGRQGGGPRWGRRWGPRHGPRRGRRPRW